MDLHTADLNIPGGWHCHGTICIVMNTRRMPGFLFTFLPLWFLFDSRQFFLPFFPPYFISIFLICWLLGCCCFSKSTLQKEGTIPMYSSMWLLPHLSLARYSHKCFSSEQLRDLQLSTHLSVALDWSTNYTYACRSELSIQYSRR